MNKELKQVADAVRVVVKCTAARADGSVFWAYVMMKPKALRAYNKAMQKGRAVDFSAFGDILSSGEGTTPPDDVREFMKERYGVSEDFENELRESMREVMEEAVRMKARGVNDETFLKAKAREFSTKLE